MSLNPVRIQRLPARLANQIAAGEVVERPASVLKELLENSLDAGATVVQIELEHAGIRRLLVQDNGSGIHADDLTLALSRHATSKIHSVDDLAAITSLGFRGEALASIASVSRLTLTSRPAQSSSAFSAFAEGSDMQVRVQPAALTPGTRVEVCDLFFNTPARRRFLRSESTELSHIDEVVKRSVLVAPHCSVTVKHHGKVWRQFHACREGESARIEAVLGKRFMINARRIDTLVEQVRVHGWLGAVNEHRASTDAQFVFVNGRPIRDRVLQHALRAGYAQHIPEGRAPTYVIYIDMPAQDVDVNVHPTKHEVRFRQARWMHDLLTSLVNQSLLSMDLVLSLRSQDVNHGGNVKNSSVSPADLAVQINKNSRASFDTKKNAEAISLTWTKLYTPAISPSLMRENKVADHAPNEAEVCRAHFLPIANEFVLLLVAQEDEADMLSLPFVLQQCLADNQGDESLKPLLFPIELPIQAKALLQELFCRFDERDGCLLLRAAPVWLKDCDWPQLCAFVNVDVSAGQVAIETLIRYWSISRAQQQSTLDRLLNWALTQRMHWREQGHSRVVQWSMLWQSK